MGDKNQRRAEKNITMNEYNFETVDNLVYLWSMVNSNNNISDKISRNIAGIPKLLQTTETTLYQTRREK